MHNKHRCHEQSGFVKNVGWGRDMRAISHSGTILTETQTCSNNVAFQDFFQLHLHDGLMPQSRI